MNTRPAHAAPAGDTAMCQPFPTPGRRVQHAHRELDLAATATKEQLKALGDIRLLPRPWDPATCTDPDLRTELWHWLDAVVTWLNSQYVWDVTGIIPACWPAHPHLVHEIAVLADQRRRAATTLTSDALEEWHRYALPAFTERTRSRIKTHCDEGHQPWPAKGRYTRHTAESAAQDRAHTYRADTASTTNTPQPPPGGARLHVIDGHHVDTTTGEILEES